MNWNSVYIYLPIQIIKNTHATADIDANMITVNNFFTYWIKEIDIKRYGDDLQILPTNNTTLINKTLLCTKKSFLYQIVRLEEQ